MSKLKAPLFSLDSHGSVSPNLTYQQSHNFTIVRKKPIPTQNVNLSAQYQRWFYKDYVSLWHEQSSSSKQSYSSLGVPYHLTGYQYFMRYHLRNLPDIGLFTGLDTHQEPTVIDLSRNGNTATLYGVTRTTGLVDGCVSFDGVNDYGYIPSDTSLNLGLEDFTIILELNGNMGNTICTLIMKANSHFLALTQGWAFSFRYDVANIPIIFSHTGLPYAGIWYATPKYLQLNNWYQYVLRADRTAGTIELLINHSSRGVIPLLGNASDIKTSVGMYFGKSYGNVFYYKGLMDTVSIYHRYMSLDDIYAHSDRTFSQ